MLLVLFAGCFPLLDKANGDSGAFDSGFPDTAGSDTTIDDTAEAGCGDADADGDGFCGEDDCEEGDSAIHAGAAEACNSADDDCDGEVDEDTLGTYYIDEDGDGYGGSSPVRACDPPDNAVDNGADCDDSAATVNPDAADDTDDDVDNDCDSEIDEDVPSEATEPEVTLNWDSSGVEVAITGGGAGWDFGMAETGVGDLGWFGESCIPGEEPYGYPDYGFDICHTLNPTGGKVTYTSNINDVDDGYTLFTDVIAAAGNITYFLERHDDGACFVWGDDPAYYDELGCELLP